MLNRFSAALAVAVLSVALAPWPVLAEAPRLEEPKRAPSAPPVRRSAAVAASPEGAVNINTAGVKELMTLTGIGKKVAEKIVFYRDTHGPFKRPEDIRGVEGVGPGLWEKNRARIVVK